MKITALVPYYGIRNPELMFPHSEPELRPGYLEQTVKSLQGLTSDIILGVHVSDSTVPAVPVSQYVVFDCAPHFIPAALLGWTQNNMGGKVGDIAYYTEADQVLHFQPDVFDAVKGDDYLVPHRLEPKRDTAGATQRGPEVGWRGFRCVIANGWPQGDGFYHPHSDDFETNRFEQYGAAFACSPELLAKTVFTYSFPDRPLEHASGFDISAAGHCLKTSAWERFFVEHLSG